MLKVLSYNVKGLNAPVKRHALAADVLRLKPDVICLQETHFKRLAHPSLGIRNFPIQYHATGPTKARGVSILIRSDVVYQLHRKISDPRGRYLILVCSLNHKTYTLVNIYSPNTEQLSFISGILHRVSLVATGVLLICGDLNYSIDPLRDVRSPKIPIPTKRSIRQGQKLRDLFSSHGLYDVWRLWHPGDSEFTFHSRVHNTYSRLDYFLLQSSSLSQVLKCEILDITWSDHAPVFLTIGEGGERGAGKAMWRFNDSILSDPGALAEIEQTLAEYFTLNNTPGVTPETLWQAHKAVLRGVCIKWASRLNQARQADKLLILSQIHVAAQANSSDPTPAHLKILLEAQARLSDWNYKALLYSQRRLKARYYAYRDRPGRLLARYLRPTVAATRISHLVLDSGRKTVYKPLEIGNALAAYYGDLYNLQSDSHPSSISEARVDRYLSDLHLPSLTSTQRDGLSSPFTELEIATTIKSLPSHKSPGPDGFTDIYYKNFSALLTPHLLSLFSSAAETGRFPEEMLRTTIVPLPKPGKSPTLCPNFRPISLLNVDVKIYAKIIANRVAELLPGLICSDQVGFIRGRQGPHNTKKLIDLIQVIQTHRLPSVLLALDAEKAFDRVDWMFLRKVLLKFGFPVSVLQSIFALYASPTASVLTAGFLSTQFGIRNGTRQGCPLSPLLYALVIEPLAQRIRQDDGVAGIMVGPTVYKIGLFADDILLTLTEPTDSLPRLSELLTEYSAVSFHKINLPKSQALTINVPGKVRESLKQTFQFEWREDYLQYLGVKISKSPDQLFDLNYKPFLAHIKQLLFKWKRKSLSWIGRIAAIKMSLLPKLLYYFRTIPIRLPKSYLDEVQSLLNHYVWNGKRPRVPNRLLNLPIRRGGLAMPHIHLYHRAAVLASLAEYFHSPRPPQWTAIEQSFAKQYLITTVIWLTRRQRPPLPDILPLTRWYLHVWDMSRTLLLNTTSLSLATPLEVLTHWIADFDSARWTSRGIGHLHQLISGGKMLTFEMLQQRYRLTEAWRLSYYQITSVIRRPGTSFQPTLPQAPLSPFARFVIQPSTQAKLLSICYAALNVPLPDHTWSFQKAWEGELGIKIPPQDWERAFALDRGAYRCTSLMEVRRKVLYRWYLVPARECHVNHKVSPICWRCERLKGTMIHVWWECEAVEPFWRGVAGLVEKAIGLAIPFAPADFLLGISKVRMDRWQKKLFSVITSSTMLLIARSWKQQRVPIVREIRDMVNNTRDYELMARHIYDFPQPEKDHWSLWDSMLAAECTVDLGVPG
uniref:Reverse transcriptase domain-containing protein n=1 Tax=Leptobrachium leishanense TaxID=445787 RepID=A0A8C5M1H2_9ANUR